MKYLLRYLAFLILLPGCAGTSKEPTHENIAGRYEAAVVDEDQKAINGKYPQKHYTLIFENNGVVTYEKTSDNAGYQTPVRFRYTIVNGEIRMNTILNGIWIFKLVDQNLLRMDDEKETIFYRKPSLSP
ncbi:MAG: hypothetical protein V4507_07230 [Verrucomicrobiota bacterium]